MIKNKNSITRKKYLCIIMLVLIIGCLINLNMVNFEKITGNVTLNNNYESNYCAVVENSDSFIRITGSITQDYGEDGIAVMTFKSKNRKYEKKVNVKTDEKMTLDFAIPKDEYTLTIEKINYKTYYATINNSINVTFKLKYDLTKKNYVVGDEICLENECFYVIKDDGNSIKAMAKYNLLVGSIVELNDKDEVVNSELIDSNSEGYGLQNKNAIASTSSSKTWIGSIAFADTFYWTDENGSLKSEYGTSYPTWVFNNQSNLWQHIYNYQNYIKNLGYDNITVTLPSYGDVVNLGCSGWSCANAPSWVYNTSYYLASAGDGTRIWRVDSGEYFNRYGAKSTAHGGLRPIINIAKY